MKTKVLLALAVISAATALSAQARFYVGVSVGFCAPAPVVVTAPVLVAPAPVMATPTVVVAAPACPGPGYGWAPGYWSVCGYNRVWVPGCWQHRQAPVVYAHSYGWHRW